MQVKPRFENYRIVEQHPIIKDDTGNEMCLTLLEVKLHSNDFEVMETTYKFWAVIGRNQHQWNNKAISYENVAFWKTRKKLFKDVVQGFLVEEFEDGKHKFIDDNVGLRTIFKIKRIN